jgi:hypothetical protein
MTERPNKTIDLNFGEMGIRYDFWIKGSVRYWDEAVAEYKDYLRRRKPGRIPKETGMDKFREHLQNLSKC